ncbi:MAG: response regulator, partial [Desulfobacteraceae bacterium]|nr:response regulator [Desulfobacteraceae bacterium]
ILVVDDNKDNRMILEKILQSLGSNPVMVESGQQAYEKLSSGDGNAMFDLIIIDLIMPDIAGDETVLKIRSDLNITIPIIMMGAFGEKRLEKLEQEKKINGCVYKPVNASSLFDMILNAFGKETSSPKTKEKVTVATYQNKIQGIHILLVEDNSINQEIATAVLEKAKVDLIIANNGREAVQVVQQHDFDIVLMDIQMPEMDGYEATKMIRAKEKYAGLPIIAMTAHAMKGDKEKCLSAGMDGYITKPINQEELFKTISKFTSSPSDAENVTNIDDIPEVETIKKEIQSKPGNQMLENLPGIDVGKVLAALNLPQSVYKKILIGFLNSCESLPDQFETLVQKEDWKALFMLAHSIKGSSGNIGAYDLQAVAKKLESTARQADSGTPDKEKANKEAQDVIVKIKEVLKALPLVMSDDTIDEQVQSDAVDQKDLAELLTQMATALDQSDPDDIIWSFKKLKNKLDAKDSNLLSEKIDGYDYDEALDLIRVIKDREGIYE